MADSSAQNEVESPDGRRVAFLRDYNLWVRDTKTKAETALTTDGIKDFGYATDNAGYATTDKPVLRWSPDSRKIATFRQDQRRVDQQGGLEDGVGPRRAPWGMIGLAIVTAAAALPFLAFLLAAAIS